MAAAKPKWTVSFFEIRTRWWSNLVWLGFLLLPHPYSGSAVGVESHEGADAMCFQPMMMMVGTYLLLDAMDACLVGLKYMWTITHVCQAWETVSVLSRFIVDLQSQYCFKIAFFLVCKHLVKRFIELVSICWKASKLSAIMVWCQLLFRCSAIDSSTIAVPQHFTNIDITLLIVLEQLNIILNQRATCKNPAH